MPACLAPNQKIVIAPTSRQPRTGESYETDAEEVIYGLEYLNCGIASLRQSRVESVPR
jgi:hypothetical protein